MDREQGYFSFSMKEKTIIAIYFNFLAMQHGILLIIIKFIKDYQKNIIFHIKKLSMKSNAKNLNHNQSAEIDYNLFLSQCISQEFSISGK